MKTVFFLLLSLGLCPLLFAVSPRVKTGIELLLEKHFDLIKGKNVGIITNHTGRLPDGRHIVDVLHERADVKVVALFGPEHGIRGDAPDGRSIEHGVDTKTGIKVYSLYGKITKPTDEMLKGIDVLIFDIQDVGVRFYTYTSTMSLAMEAAAEHNLKYIVLDRPNPIRGVSVEGAVVHDSLKSFIGIQSIPVAHGMTIGELAKMFNEEGWLKNGVKADLTVIPIEHWKRTMWFDETGLPWVNPSPNMMALSTAIVYPGACFIEGTNLSEGRGTSNPFEYIGAPFIEGTKLATELNASKLPGVTFLPIEFTPMDIATVTTNPKYEGQKCGGVYIKVTDRNEFEPVKMGIYFLHALKKLYPNDFRWRESRSGGALYIDKLTGTVTVRDMIDAGKKPWEITVLWHDELKKFKTIREKYLLY
jgi:uncharacterized protein YbbC (DUF1343 family)